MANPTTNYGWPMPTSTDLVTDLPADFAAFGQPVDTSLKALNPETTLGDIAYRSATSNTNTRLGIGTNGQVLAVSGGVPAWTTTADVTPLTTKGDLFTFDTADARLGVGTNGQILVADSTASTGLKWATPATAGYVGVSCNRTTQGLALVNGTQVVIPYPSTDGWDTNAFHDPASNNTRITIPTGYGGKYLFNFTMCDNTASPGYIYSVLKVNGTNVTTGYGVVTSTYPSMIKSTDVLQMSLCLVLAAADYVEIAIQTDRTNTDSISSTFQATYLGA